MGCILSKHLKLNFIQTCLLKHFQPEELVDMATMDPYIYNLCISNVTLRRRCLYGAVRRYHAERLFVAEVHNRTADYMKLLDHFLKVEDENDMRKKSRNSNSCLKGAFRSPRIQETSV